MLWPKLCERSMVGFLMNMTYRNIHEVGLVTPDKVVNWRSPPRPLTWIEKKGLHFFNYCHIIWSTRPCRTVFYLCHVRIVNATMISSVRISAEKLIATMWINSSSNKIRAPYMMTPPEYWIMNVFVKLLIPTQPRMRGTQCRLLTLINADQHPHEECFVAETSPLRQFFIQFRIRDGNIRANVLIEYQRKYRKHGVQCCISNH